MAQLLDQDDEFDIHEVFSALWWNIRLIVGFTALFFAAAAYYAISVATPQYEASVRFELLESQQSGSPWGEAAGLATLVGLGFDSNSSKSDELQDRILSRPFVDSIFEVAEFETDPIFNKSLRDPGLLEDLETFFLGESKPRNLSRIDHLVEAIEVLEDRMQVSKAENGFVSLSILHPDPRRAANIANVIVEQALLDIFRREQEQTRSSLNYFGGELLKVRRDLDSASAAVRDYAISNNLQSPEELARSSSQLSQLRRDLNVVEESLKALAEIEVGTFNGIDLADKFPIALSVSFRRLVGFGSDPVSWKRPSQERLVQAKANLESQKVTLASSFSALEARAKRLGIQALELATLEREVEVQRAIYESVITQFEARSLFSGFERASGRVIESAIPAKEPTSPKIGIVLVLGILFGVVFGCAFSLIMSAIRKTIFTKLAMEKTLEAIRTVDLKPRDIKLMSGKSSSARLTFGEDLFVALPQECRSIAMISTTNAVPNAKIALEVAKVFSRVGRKTLILDLAGYDWEHGESLGSGATMITSELRFDIEGTPVVAPKSLKDYLVKSKVKEELQRHMTACDCVLVLLPETRFGSGVSSVVASEVDASLVVACRGKTVRPELISVKSTLASSQAFGPILLTV